MHHLDTNQELSKHQCDFRKGHCTVTTWLKIKNDIIKAMERGEVTLVVMGVDFEILMQKLHELNLSKCSLKNSCLLPTKPSSLCTHWWSWIAATSCNKLCSTGKHSGACSIQHKRLWHEYENWCKMYSLCWWHKLVQIHKTYRTGHWCN